jgi:hypothetical protein
MNKKLKILSHRIVFKLQKSKEKNRKTTKAKTSAEK